MELDYQKDSYTGVREYRYENGNLILLTVKGKTINSNIKVDGIIKNGSGTISVDEDGNTSLYISIEKWCAVKSFTDKTFTVDVIDGDLCGTTIVQDECHEVDVLKSYDINLQNCKTFFGPETSTFYDDSDLTLLTVRIHVLIVLFEWKNCLLLSL